METEEQAPWAGYVVIPDDDSDWYLSEDAPEDVKKKYQERLRQIDEMARKGIRIPK